jgi:hypothetical protein
MTKDHGNKKRREPRQRKEPTPEERAARVLRELRQLCWDIGEEHGLSRSEPFPVSDLVLPISLDLRGFPSDGIANDAASKLQRELSSRVVEGLAALTAYRQGRVYCFQCDSAGCAHSEPTSRDSTFGGYTATGKPAWQTFLNFCMERKDPRVDRLYGERAGVIAVTQTASELKGELLPAFGKGSLAFNVLGQVVVGLVPFNLCIPGGDDERVAITVQLVETRSSTEKRRLRVNLLGMSADDIAGADEEGGVGNRAGRLRYALRSARQRLNSVGRQLARAERTGHPLDLEDKVVPILSKLRSDLDKILRLERFKTSHALERQTQKERPTGAAMRDVLDVPDDRLLLDGRRETVVVLGPKLRAHIFSMEGRHITSIQMEEGELDRKIGRKRWKLLPPERMRQFRVAVAALLGE